MERVVEEFGVMEGKNEPCHASYNPVLVWNPQVYEYLSQAYGREHFVKVSVALTCPSIHSCVRVNFLQTDTKQVIKQLGLHVQGPVEPTSKLDEEPVSRSVCFEHDLLENVVMVKGRGPCQINYEAVQGERGFLKEIVVSRKCAEAVLRGAHGVSVSFEFPEDHITEGYGDLRGNLVFVPGVLACSSHIEKGELVAVSVAVERPDGQGGWLVGVTRGTTLSSEHAKSQFEDTARNGWFIGIGRAMMTRASLFRETKGVAVEMVDRVFDLPPFSGVLKGDIFLQNLPSIVTAHVLDPKPGERILDMCAAPGGKTTGIAMLMQDKGEIIALDRSHNKVLDIVRLAEELKLTCIQAIKMDALKSVRVENTNLDAGQGQLLFMDTASTPPIRNGTEERIVTLKSDLNTVLLYSAQEPMSEDPGRGLEEDISGQIAGEASTTLSNHREAPCNSCKSEGAKKVSKDDGAYASRHAARKQARKLKSGLKEVEESPYRRGFAPKSFDRVLLDAPCSALGLRPRLFAGLETLDGLRQHANYQRRLIDQAVQLVRPNGTLVYSTCTLNPGENEAVVRYALDTYPFLSLAPQHPRIGGPGLVGGQDVFDGATYRPWLQEGEQNLVQRFDPAGTTDTIGFFIAKFSVSNH